jgi:hypothetical protein
MRRRGVATARGFGFLGNVISGSTDRVDFLPRGPGQLFKKSANAFTAADIAGRSREVVLDPEVVVR